MRAGFARRRRHGEAHFARTAIGQIAHRIEPLARRARSDQDVESGEDALVRRRLEQTLGESDRLPHAPRSGFAASLIAFARPQDAHAAS